MGGRTECQAPGDAAPDTQSVENERADDSAEDTYHDDDHGGDGRDAARPLGDTHGDGSSDGFGFERCYQRPVGSHPAGDEHHADDADDASHENRGQDGDSVCFQVFSLFV